METMVTEKLTRARTDMARKSSQGGGIRREQLYVLLLVLVPSLIASFSSCDARMDWETIVAVEKVATDSAEMLPISASTAPTTPTVPSPPTTPALRPKKSTALWLRVIADIFGIMLIGGGVFLYFWRRYVAAAELKKIAADPEDAAALYGDTTVTGCFEETAKSVGDHIGDIFKLCIPSHTHE